MSQLDGYGIDTVIHLAGVTGAATEEDAFTVNVSGTRRMLRHFIDRGVKRFVVASSIAAVGCLSPDFLPRAVPIPDDHPCDSANVYGLSKALVEQTAEYLHRGDPTLDFTLFRLGVVVPMDRRPVDPVAMQEMRLAFCDLAAISLDDACDAFAIAASRDTTPGVRRMNLVAPVARTAVPTAEAIRMIMGSRSEALDLSFFERPGNEYAGVYAVDRLRDEFGYVANVSMRGKSTPALT